MTPIDSCIRPADPDRDAAALRAIYAPYIESSPASFEEVVPSAEEMGRRVRDTLTTLPWLVCERDGVVVGYAYAGVHRVRASYRWGVDVSVYIDATHHRGGVGRALYTTLFQCLVAQGFYNAYAGITLPNPASVGLHEAMGFQLVGVYHETGYKFGRWHDVGWWEMFLREDRAGVPDEPLPFPALLDTDIWPAAREAGEAILRARQQQERSE